MLRTVSVALILAAGAGVAHADADIYRWKDAQGIYHYSDQWVPGSELIKSSTKQQRSSDPSAPRTTTTSVSSDSGSSPADAPSSATAQAVKEDVAKARDQQCKQAKDAYDKAIHARRIFKSDKQGEKEYMSDADADAYRLKVRTQMDEICGTASQSQ